MPKKIPPPPKKKKLALNYDLNLEGMAHGAFLAGGPAPQTKTCKITLMIAIWLMLVIELKSGLGIKINGDTKCVRVYILALEMYVL